MTKEKQHQGNWKRIGKKLLFLPIGWILLLILLSAGMLTAVFVNGWDALPWAALVYVMAFYTLTVFCIWCVEKLPKYYHRIRAKVSANPLANRYFTDVKFKTHISLSASFAVNLLYVGINAVSAVRYQSNWFGIFAVYYAIMAVMRFLLVRYMGKNQLGERRLSELKRSRLCATILLTVNVILSGVVLMMVYFNRGFSYQGYLIYVMAAYTFYITGTAAADVIKYRKYNSPVMSVSKMIKLTSSMFSMLFLETAMFSQFGGDTPPEIKRRMIMATGGGISVAVVAMAGCQIVRATKEIRKFKRSAALTE